MADELLRLRALTRNLPLFTGVKRFQIATPRQEKIWIRDLTQLMAKLNRIKKDGINQLDVVTDYDFTLTKHKYEGRHCQSLFGIWGAATDLPEDFRTNFVSTYQKYVSLYRRYGPYETDPTISFVQKVSLIDEFYRIQKKMLVDHGLDRRTTEKIMNGSNIVFRYGAKYFFNRTAQLAVPVYIISGGISDVLYNTIHSIVRDKRLDNIYTYANRLKWNGDTVCGFEDMTVHSYNKFRVIPEFVRERKNCILMGDLVADYYMTLKSKYATQISIFYAKEGDVENRKAAARKFDVIVENDESMRFAVLLLNYLSNTELDMEYVKDCHETLATVLNPQTSKETEKVAKPEPQPIVAASAAAPEPLKQAGTQKPSPADAASSEIHCVVTPGPIKQ